MPVSFYFSRSPSRQQLAEHVTEPGWNRAQEFGPGFLAQRAAVAKMPYTEAVITESLRIISGAKSFGGTLAPLSKRIAREDVSCGGYRIPAGMRTILVTPYMINSEEVFQLKDGTFDMAFRPERFIKACSSWLPLSCLHPWRCIYWAARSMAFEGMFVAAHC